MERKNIDTIQNKIYEKYKGNVLHILNGNCMLEEFKKSNWIKEKFTYIPFNEAMCWGEADEYIFSENFIEQRAKSLNSTKEQYKNIVLNPLQPLMKEKFDVIVLWFGDDMFCQINMLTILAFLEQYEFKGKVLAYILNEKTNEIISESKIYITGSLQIYKSIVCKKEMVSENLTPIMHKAELLYLNYKNEDSEINSYILQNIRKEKRELINDLMKRFPQYGLGDLQYELIIKNVKVK